MKRSPCTIRWHELFVLSVVLGLLAGFPLAVLAQTPAPQGASAEPPNALAGSESYAQNCAACHGASGRGDGSAASGLGVPPTAFADYGVTANLPLAEWFNVTKNGRMQRMMPPWGSRLSDQQIWNTIAYAWTLHTSPQEIAAGKGIYEAECAACHGLVGRGRAPAPDLSDFGRTSGVSQSAWAQVVMSGRNTMPAFNAKLSAAEQRAVLEYTRSLSLGALFRGPLPKGSGVISGTVTNRTTSQPVAGLQIELGIFDSSSLLETRTSATDAAGFYRFDGLPTDPTMVYVTQVEYPADIQYSSTPASFAAGAGEMSLSLSVYEPTADASGIRADRVHFIIEFDAATNQMFITELAVYSLSGNRAFVGDGMGTLRFTLPANASDLTISDGVLGVRYVPVADGFVDTVPMPPGQGVRQMLYSYAIPYSGDTLDLVRTLPYPAAAVNALIVDAGEQVASEQLANQGLRQTQNGNFINLVGQNIAANQPVNLRFTGLTALTAAVEGSGQPVSSTGADRAVLLIVAGVVGAGVAALVAWPLLRRRAAAEWDVETDELDRDDLIDALARLDLAHQAGEVPDSAYRDQRLRLKARLLDLVRTDVGPDAGSPGR